MATHQVEQPVLNTAAAGLEWAERVAADLRTGEDVRMSFAQVQRMTPSFANAFAMTLLEEFPEQTLRERLHLVDLAPNVAASINRSIQRYRSGIRLSTQRPTPA